MLKNMLLLFSIYLPSSMIYGSPCNFLPKAERPEWANMSDVPESDFFISVGTSNIDRKDFNGSLEIAKKNAISSLANSIQTTVSNSAQLQTIKRSGGKNTSIEKIFKDVVESSTLVSLKNVSTNQAWLDRGACTIWILAKVSKKDVYEEQKKTINQELVKIVVESVENMSSLEKLSDRVQVFDSIDILLNAIDDTEPQTLYETSQVRQKTIGFSNILKTLRTKPVTLNCSYQTLTSKGFWQKSCDLLASEFRKSGIQVEVSNQQPNQKSGVHIKSYIKGKITKEVEANSVYGERSKFSGEAGLVIEGNELQYSDIGEFMSGWSAAGDSMLLDIIGISISQRKLKNFNSFMLPSTRQSE